jgi:hypothetical protein
LFTVIEVRRAPTPLVGVQFPAESTAAQLADAAVDDWFVAQLTSTDVPTRSVRYG